MVSTRVLSPFAILGFNMVTLVPDVARAVGCHDDVERDHLTALMDRVKDRIVLHVVPVLRILDTQVKRTRRINHDVLGLAAAIVLKLWRVERL